MLIILLLQELKPDDGELNFTDEILNKIDENQSFLDHIIFTDEATLYINGCVNKHTTCIWRSDNSHDIIRCSETHFHYMKP